MRWMLEVAYIGILSSWRWLLGSAAVVGALVGLLFAVGVLGGGSDGSGAALPSAIASPTPTPAASTNPTAVPQPTPTLPPILEPIVAPTVSPTVAPAPKFISVPILATRANNVGSLEFVLVYDSAKLELEQVERGLLSGDALIDFSTPLAWKALDRHHRSQRHRRQRPGGCGEIQNPGQRGRQHAIHVGERRRV